MLGFVPTGLIRTAAGSDVLSPPHSLQTPADTFETHRTLKYDPAADSAFYLLTDQKIYHTRDAGTTWRTAYTGDAAIADMLASRVDPEILYVADKQGLVRIDTEKGTHERLATGLPAGYESLASLTMDEEGTLFASQEKGSTLRWTGTVGTKKYAAPLSSRGIVLLGRSVQVTLDKAESVTLTVHDLSGRLISQSAPRVLAPGIHTLLLDTEKQASGARIIGVRVGREYHSFIRTVYH